MKTNSVTAIPGTKAQESGRFPHKRSGLIDLTWSLPRGALSISQGGFVMKRFSILFLVTLVCCPVASDANSCEGQELERTKQIVEYAYLSGIAIGHEVASTGDMQSAMQKLLVMSQQVNEAARELPPSCQLLIQQWSNAIGGGSPGSSGPRCMGGVCCDSTGCY